MLYVITLLGADSWMESGVQGLQSVVLYSLPELDGAIETMVLGKSAVLELSLRTRSNSISALLCCQQYFSFFCFMVVAFGICISVVVDPVIFVIIILILILIL